jgi:hypothetical protein
MTTIETTTLRAYAPALEARKNLSEIAATRPLSLYGVAAPGALEAPGEMTFGEFIRHPQTPTLWGKAEDSDATRLLLEFQQAFAGVATRKDLTAFVRAHHMGKPRGFRYWNRLAASIWKLFLGVVRGKECTSKAHEGEVQRLARAETRRGREAERSALRRVLRNESETRTLPAAKLRKKARWLSERADKKCAESKAFAQTAAELRAQAAALEAEALRLDPKY